MLARMGMWATILSQHLSEIASSYRPNELAYLALTQKVEQTFRDSLAFSLYRALGDSMGLVCREWRRFDLAVVRDSLPSLLLEAKAIYTFDIVTEGAQHGYPEQLRSDVEKALRRRVPETEVFTLLLATHVHEAPSQRCVQSVKYFNDVRKFALRGITIEDAKAEVGRRLSAHPLAAIGAIEAGVAFDVRASVAYWLFGPYECAI